MALRERGVPVYTSMDDALRVYWRFWLSIITVQWC